MTGYENIRRMCFPLVTPVLPSVFDDSLSYYECLTHVVSVLNKTIDAVNFIGNNTEQLFNQWLMSTKTKCYKLHHITKKVKLYSSMQRDNIGGKQ